MRVTVQATVRSFDPESRSGVVLLDDGARVPFDREAFDAGPLRHLRSGQRVALLMADGRVSYLTLSTFPVPGEGDVMVDTGRV